MSWLFSQALVAAFSVATCSAGEPSAQLNVMPTPHPFWHNAKTTDFSRLSLFGPTCAPLTEDRGTELLTWYLADSRAKTSASLARETVWTENDPDCGPKWRGWWAKFDHGSSSWRTAQCSLLEGSEPFSETWPRSGLMLLGKCYPLPNAMQSTSANESGLWPTPTVCGNYNRPGASATSGMGLASAVKLWPTPTAGNQKSRGSMQEWGGSWNWVRKEDPDLARGPLNPEWVEWLMGWPIGWTDLRPLAMARFHEWQQQHGSC